MAATIEYETCEVRKGVVTLQRGGVDREFIFPVSGIVAIDVDWDHKSGSIRFIFGPMMQVVYTSTEEDSGQACADAITELFVAWQQRAAIKAGA